MPDFTDDWINWIYENVQSGQDKNGIFKILLDNGFDYNQIVIHMDYTPTIPEESLINPHDLAARTNTTPAISYFYRGQES